MRMTRKKKPARLYKLHYEISFITRQILINISRSIKTFSTFRAINLSSHLKHLQHLAQSIFHLISNIFNISRSQFFISFQTSSTSRAINSLKNVFNESRDLKIRKYCHSRSQYNADQVSVCSSLSYSRDFSILRRHSKESQIVLRHSRK